MDGMQVGHRSVLPHICGNRRIHAYVSCTAEGMDYYPLKLYKLRWAIETNYNGPVNSDQY